MKKKGIYVLLALSSLLGACTDNNQTKNESKDMKNPNLNTSLAKAEQLILTDEWDKVFPKSESVDHKKVTFVNRYGITLAADMYTPRNATGKLPAVAVSGPFGAVKEESSGKYAQKLAEKGYLTIAFDPSFTGESGGNVRRVASPDINVEDFSAAVDFLSVQPVAGSSSLLFSESPLFPSSLIIGPSPVSNQSVFKSE